MANEPATPNPHRPNLWGMIAKVMVTGITQGQLLLVIIGLILIIFAIKMPAQDVKPFLEDVLKTLKSGFYLGWILAAVCIGVTIRIIYVTKKIYNKKESNLIEEKNKLLLENKELNKKLTNLQQRKNK